MKRLLLLAILATLSVPCYAQQQPAAKQLSGSIHNADWRSANNAGVDLMAAKDYAAAEGRFTDAYRGCIGRGDNPDRIFQNLVTLYTLQGKNEEIAEVRSIQRRQQAAAAAYQRNVEIQRLQAQGQGQNPGCSSCMQNSMWAQMQAQQGNTMEVLGSQQGFDRTTFRETNSLDMQMQRDRLDAQRTELANMQGRQAEQQAIQNHYAGTAAGMGTSYWSQYSGKH